MNRRRSTGDRDATPVDDATKSVPNRYSLRSRTEGYVAIPYRDLQHGTIVETDVIKKSIAKLTAEKRLRSSNSVNSKEDFEDKSRDSDRKRKSDVVSNGADAHTSSGENKMEFEMTDSTDDSSSCICKSQKTTGTMVECDDCRKWFHETCVGLCKDEMELIDASKIGFRCPDCAEKEIFKTPNNIRLLDIKDIYDRKKCKGPGCANSSFRPTLFCAVENGTGCIEKYVEAAREEIRRDYIVKKLSAPANHERVIMLNPENGILITREMRMCPTWANVVTFLEDKPNYLIVTPRMVKTTSIRLETYYSEKFTDGKIVETAEAKRPRLGSSSLPSHEAETVRFKVRDVLYRDLNERAKNVDYNIDEEAILQIACSVEAKMFEVHKGVSEAYNKHFTSFVRNLCDKKNEDFFKYVLTGVFTPIDLARMHSNGMSSEFKRYERLLMSRRETQRWVKAAEVVDETNLIANPYDGRFDRVDPNDFATQDPTVTLLSESAAEDSNDDRPKSPIKAEATKYGVVTDHCIWEGFLHMGHSRSIKVRGYTLGAKGFVPSKLIMKHLHSYRDTWHKLNAIVSEGKRELTALVLVPNLKSQCDLYEKFVVDLAIKDKCGILVSGTDNREITVVPFMNGHHIFSMLIEHGFPDLANDHEPVIVAFSVEEKEKKEI